jgi:hypothetical protein
VHNSSANHRQAIDNSLATQRTICSAVVGSFAVEAAILSAGTIVSEAKLGVGFATMRLDEKGAVIEISEDGETFLDALAKRISRGDILSTETQKQIASLMAETIVHFLADRKPVQIVARLLIGEPLSHSRSIDEYWISGLDNCAWLADEIAASFQERGIAYRLLMQ